MDFYTQTELAYKKGYENGKRDAVVHGRWRYEDCCSPNMSCSVCGALAPWDIIKDYFCVRTNYCPGCGAKMEGPKDD